MTPTQADREEAWAFVPRNSIAGQDYEGFMAGKYDDSRAVQAFARHRLAAEAAAFEKAAGVGYRICAETRHVALGDKVATAIRKFAGEKHD